MIYLDYQATTPLAPDARDEMMRWLDGPGGSGFGNPHSPHRMGREAAAAIALARDRVAALFPPGGKEPPRRSISPSAGLPAATSVARYRSPRSNTPRCSTPRAAWAPATS